MLEGIKDATLQQKVDSILKSHFSNIKCEIQNYNLGFITGDECISALNKEIENTLNRIYNIRVLELKEVNREHLEEIVFKP